MSILRIASLAGAVALSAIGPAGAKAQLGGGVVLTPFVGVYSPSTDVGRLSVTSQGATALARPKQQTGGAVGTTASYWISGRFAIEAGVLYTSSDVKGSPFAENGSTQSSEFTQHANLWFASTKLMVQVLPADNELNLRFGVGPALITRYGTAYDNSQGKMTGLTDVGGVMSLCTRANLTPSLGVRLRAEDYIYRTKLGFESSINPSNNARLAARTQNDFVFSAGMQFFLNR